MPDSNVPPLLAAEPCPLGPGDTLSGRYAIEHLVGEGTFGWVFSAVDVLEPAPRRVAIKLLRQRYSSGDEGVRRFERRELALLLRVRELAPTPHVVHALEDHVLVHEGHPYLVLEFIEGPSLREVMDQQRLKTADIQRLGEELARGLAAIHAAGGVHRDLKPTNIRLRKGTQAVIVDLGINRALWDTQEFTGTGQALMTPRYASPEQGVRLDVGPASDVYSLGLILYELLTGDVPLRGEDIQGVLASQRTRGSSTSPDGEAPLPRALRACVMRCLHPNPRRRPQASTVAMSLSPAASRWRGDGLRARWGIVLAGLAALTVLGTRLGSAPSERPRHPREWSRAFRHPEVLGRIGAVKTDASNNVFILGGFRGILDFGGKPLERKKDVGLFLVKLGPEGKPLWRHGLGQGSAWQWPAELATSPEGDLWIQGQFNATIDLGSGCPELVSIGKDGFLARLDGEGQCLWALQLGGDGDQVPTRLVATSDGEVVVGGFFSGQLKVGGETLVSMGPMDSFVARFSAEGALRWVRQLKSPQETELGSLTLGRTGAILFTGPLKDSIELEGTALDGDGAPSFFAGALDENGRLSWLKRLECGPAPDGGSLSSCTSLFDATGSALLTLVLSKDSRSERTAFLTRIDVEGGTRWTKKLGTCDECSWTLSTAADGRILAWGSVQGRMDLGDGPSSGPGGKDIFLMEFTPDGDRIQARRFSNGVNLKLLSATTDDTGDWVLVGSFVGRLDLGTSRLEGTQAPDLFVAHLLRQPEVSAIPGAMGTACSPPPTDLVAWYSFDGTGPEVPSVGGVAPSGRLEGRALLVPGRGGRVLSPNGGFFQVPDSEAFALDRGPFSLSAWIQTSDEEGIGLILDKFEEPEGTGPKVGYQIGLDRGRLAFVLGVGRDSDGGPQKENALKPHTIGRFLADGAWHLVSVTVERKQSKGATLYVDGELISQLDTTPYRGSLDTNIPFRVGIRSDQVSSPFRGLIDDVALWKRVLSPEEIAGLYRAGRTGMCGSAAP